MNNSEVAEIALLIEQLQNEEQPRLNGSIENGKNRKRRKTGKTRSNQRAGRNEELRRIRNEMTQGKAQKISDIYSNAIKAEVLRGK